MSPVAPRSSIETVRVQGEKSELIAALMSNALRCQEQGELEAAKQLCMKVLALDVRNADALHLLGLLLFQMQQPELALKMINRALAIDDGQALYHYNLGVVLKAIGEFDQAELAYRRAIQLIPEYVDAFENLATLLQEQNRMAEALIPLEKVVALQPKRISALVNLGCIYQTQERWTEAEETLKRAIEVDPNRASAYTNLGVLCMKQGRTKEAQTMLEKSLFLDPEFAHAHNNLGSVCQDQGDFIRALDCYNYALRISPGWADALFNRSKLRLLQGEFELGWKEYEARSFSSNFNTPRRSYRQPLWRGQSLAQEQLLLWGEQGLGDEIMFASLIPEAIATGSAIKLECDARLLPLFSRSFTGVEVVARCDQPTENDKAVLLSHVTAHLPTGSLPSIFRTKEEDFSRTQSPYLFASNKESARLKASYKCNGKLIGLAWYSKNLETGLRRSISLARFGALFQLPGVSWISLQYGDHDAIQCEAKEADAPLIVDRTIDQLRDVDQFAAQIAAMDLVITIDNSTAHLAAALGRPVWLLLPNVPEWRWMLNRADSLWYPTMRLFRQEVEGDWESVLLRVAEELMALKGS